MMTTGNSNHTPNIRHAGTVPTSRFQHQLPSKLVQGEDNKNPADFPVHPIDEEVPASPGLVDPKAPSTVIPLDLAIAQQIVRDRAALWDGEDADARPFDPTPKPVVVRDSVRKYAFKGVRLAYVSSEQPDKQRWTDIAIYRTESGILVAHRIAVTTVAHQEGCEILVRFHKKYTTGLEALGEDEFGPEDRTPCEKCKPDIQAIMNSDPTALYCERDRHTVKISVYPETIIQSLHTIKNNQRTLGPLAASALQLAADRDPNLAAVFYGEPLN